MVLFYSSDSSVPLHAVKCILHLFRWRKFCSEAMSQNICQCVDQLRLLRRTCLRVKIHKGY
jgi:hypothetical protein